MTCSTKDSLRAGPLVSMTISERHAQPGPIRTTQEVADLLGISRDTVERDERRALLKLREALMDEVMR